MANTPDPLSVDGEKHQDISQLRANPAQITRPIQRVNVDFSAPMLQELDTAALELNISRQAVIKTLLRHALDQHYLADRARNRTGILGHATAIGADSGGTKNSCTNACTRISAIDAGSGGVQELDE